MHKKFIHLSVLRRLDSFSSNLLKSPFKMYSFFVGFTLVAACSVSGQQVSLQEFTDAIVKNGFQRPNNAQYQGYVRSLRAGKMNTKMEAAMFLAQCLHESGGLKRKRERKCTEEGQSCSEYQTGDWTDCPESRPNERFFGRGYLQLTYCSNYRAASQYLGMGEQLADNPDLVAQSEDLSWSTSAWFWQENVKKVLAEDQSAFGLTTKAINGQIEECQGNGKNADKSRQRFRFYQKIFQVYKLQGQPNEYGCDYDSRVRTEF